MSNNFIRDTGMLEMLDTGDAVLQMHNMEIILRSIFFSNITFQTWFLIVVTYKFAACPCTVTVLSAAALYCRVIEHVLPMDCCLWQLFS